MLHKKFALLITLYFKGKKLQQCWVLIGKTNMQISFSAGKQEWVWLNSTELTLSGPSFWRAWIGRGDWLKEMSETPYYNLEVRPLTKLGTHEKISGQNLKNWVRFHDLKIWRNWDFTLSWLTKIPVTQSIFSCPATQYVLLCVCLFVCVFSVFDMKYFSLWISRIF